MSNRIHSNSRRLPSDLLATRTVSILAGMLMLAVVVAPLAHVHAGEAQPAPSTKTAKTKPAFEFAYEDINPRSPSFGKVLNLTDLYANDGVVLNFLASWCPPCWHEAPALTRMSREVTVPVVCVAADEYGPSTDVLSRAEKVGLTLPIVLVPKDKIAEMEAHYDHGMLPTTYWINGQGNIVERIEGQLDERGLLLTTRKNLPASTR